MSLCHGLDFNRMINKKSHNQPEDSSSCHGTENVLGFWENRHVLKKDCDSAPILTGVNGQLCVIPSQAYDFQINRMKQERIDHPVRIRIRYRYFQKNRIFAKRIYHAFTEWLAIAYFRKNRIFGHMDLMSSNCVGFNFMNIKRTADSKDRINVIS